MNIRSFEVPTEMKHGLGAIKTLADEARALGMKRPLLVTDSGIDCRSARPGDRTA